MFEMENTSTGNAAKLAVLWRDRKKQEEAAAGVPDRFVSEVMAGALVDPVAGRPLVESATVFTQPPPVGAPQVGGDLTSLYALVAELRAVLVDQATRQLRPTQSVLPAFAPPTEDDTPYTARPFHGGSIETAILDLLRLAANNTVYPGGNEFVEAMRAAAAAPGTGLSSVFDVAADLKRAILGTGIRPTDPVKPWLDGELAEGELPFFGISLLQWAKNVDSRLGSLESRIASLESAS